MRIIVAKRRENMLRHRSADLLGVRHQYQTNRSQNGEEFLGKETAVNGENGKVLANPVIIFNPFALLE